MKVITNREIEYSNACGCSAIDGDYSNGEGKGKEKVKNIVSGIKDSGALDLLGGLFKGKGKGKGKGKDGGNIIETSYTPAPAQPMGMTTTTKILIGVGGVSVLGLGYYLFTKKK